MKKRKKKKRPNVNILLSHVNHTFFILDLPIEHHTFKLTNCTLENKNKNCDVKKGPIQGSIYFKLVHMFLVLGPLSKVALKVRPH